MQAARGRCVLVEVRRIRQGSMRHGTHRLRCGQQNRDLHTCSRRQPPPRAAKFRSMLTQTASSSLPQARLERGEQQQSF